MMDAVVHEFVNLKQAGLELIQAGARLAASRQARGNRVLVLCADEAQAREMDEVLWTFDPVSFVPHGLWRGQGGEEEPVLVCFQESANYNQAEVLISLYIPDLLFAQKFGCVIQFVPPEAGPELEKARNRYRELKKKGVRLVHTTKVE